MKNDFDVVTIQWDKKARKVINSFQVPFYPTDSIKQSVIAYDAKTGKFLCNYTADDVYDRRRFKLYTPTHKDYRKYYSDVTQQFVDQLNARQELPLAVLVMGLKILFDENYFENLLASGYLEELTKGDL